MKKPDPINKVQHEDEFSSGLMEAYGRWMGGDTFQNTQMPDLHLSEAPFDGMDPQSNGAEIEQTSIKKKEAKKPSAKAQLATKEEVEVCEKCGQNPCVCEEVLEREEFEVDGETYVIEKAKGLDGKACWKGYKLAGTKKKGGKTVDNCVKAGDELTHDGEELSEKKKLDPVGKEDKDIDNDGDHDESDKYLIARRKKVGKILAMKKKK